MWDYEECVREESRMGEAGVQRRGGVNRIATVLCCACVFKVSKFYLGVVSQLCFFIIVMLFYVR